jgi:hypothetical protein
MAAALEDHPRETKEGELHDLLFGIRRSIRYHNRRRRFFDGFDKFVKILSVIGGSAAVAAIVGKIPWLAITLTTSIAILSAINLVVGPAQAARLHAELAKRFAKLEHDIVRAENCDLDAPNKLVAERLLIESDEPPIMRVLDTICHNELCEAMGYDACESYSVGWFQALLAHVIDLWPSKIKKNTQDCRPDGAQHNPSF